MCLLREFKRQIKEQSIKNRDVMERVKSKVALMKQWSKSDEAELSKAYSVSHALA